MPNFGNVQLDQIVTDLGYKSLGSLAREELNLVMDRIQRELDSPLRLHATFPVANAVLNLSIAPIVLGDGANKALPPVKSQVYTLAASTINFQTQATTGATFVITWPASIVGQFRRAGLSLLGNGTIQVLFSAEAASVGALANAGTVFVKSGVALGYIDLECTNILGYFKSAGAETNIIQNSSIYRFSAGSGGGSGTGDMTQFQSNLAMRLTSSFYGYVTPNEFSIDEATLISAATATFDIVDGAYSFTAASQLITSVQMFDAEFLATDDDSLQLELHAEWFSSATRDDAAIYQASLNGSAYEAIPMTRQGLSQKFTGSKLMAVPANATVSTQAGGVTNTELNATTLQAISAPFTLTSKNAVRQLVLEIDELGTPPGSYIISICANNAGVPGDVLYSTTGLASSLVSGLNVLTLSGFRSILPAGIYHIRIETDATYKAGFSAGVNSLRVRTSASGGNDIVFNGTVWSVGTVDVKYTLSGHIFDLRVRIASSASGRKLKGYGIFYAESVGDIVTGYQNLQKFSFSGDLNTTSFAITQFLPDPDALKVYDISSGQVYRYPAFNIDGRTVSFPAGTFLVPSAAIQLIFDQSEGTGFDNSDANANLMASNKLGSNDPTIDKSSNGRGILIRNSAGLLREIWLDESDNLNITAFKG